MISNHLSQDEIKAIATVVARPNTGVSSMLKHIELTVAEKKEMLITADIGEVPKLQGAIQSLQTLYDELKSPELFISE